MAKKRQAPIEQLRSAGKIAKQMLIARGLEAEESVIDKLIKDSRAPMLPGIPAYLPHEWTLQATRQIMRDILILWMEKHPKREGAREDITKFWLFVRNQLDDQEKAFEKDEKAMPALLASMKNVPVLRDIFSPMRKRENVNAIHRFLVDSFAVAIVVKQAHTTSEYIDWLLTWTQDLGLLWVRPDQRHKVKRT